MLTNKTEGHSKKISSPAAHCDVPLLVHFQLAKAYQQLSRIGDWNILFPVTL